MHLNTIIKIWSQNQIISKWRMIPADLAIDCHLLIFPEGFPYKNSFGSVKS